MSCPMGTKTSPWCMHYSLIQISTLVKMCAPSAVGCIQRLKKKSDIKFYRIFYRSSKNKMLQVKIDVNLLYAIVILCSFIFSWWANLTFESANLNILKIITLNLGLFWGGQWCQMPLTFFYVTYLCACIALQSPAVLIDCSLPGVSKQIIGDLWWKYIHKLSGKVILVWGLQMGLGSLWVATVSLVLALLILLTARDDYRVMSELHCVDYMIGLHGGAFSQDYRK